MSQRRPKREAEAGGRLLAQYEGPDVLGDLLARAGCPLSVDEVAASFKQALATGEQRSDAVPALFPDEPRFGSPDEARRLYSNLFGLWDGLAAGLDPAGEVVEEEPPAAPAPELPPRGEADDPELSPQLVEAVWKHLAALAERDGRRLRDRFESAQPDLAAWLDAVPLPDAGAVAAQDLAFETWAMFDVAFGDRLQAVAFRELRALEAEPPPLEASQPALAAYAAESLDLLQEEDPAVSAAARAQIERLVATIAAALGEAVEGEPGDDA